MEMDRPGRRPEMPKSSRAEFSGQMAHRNRGTILPLRSKRHRPPSGAKLRLRFKLEEVSRPESITRRFREAINGIWRSRLYAGCGHEDGSWQDLLFQVMEDFLFAASLSVASAPHEERSDTEIMKNA
uniref:(northern house mosquito) hypothetical protein n=1 Tax=Culex pipiens TaxID=7175 RepID=A0A8D8FEQ1_CULPI